MRLRLTDFDIAVDSGFSERDRPLNLRTWPVVEEFRFELAKRPRVEAPFGKLLIRLVEKNADLPPKTVLQLLDVMNVWHHVAETDLLGPETRRNTLLLDITEQALDAVNAKLGWSNPELHEINRALRSRDRLGWIDLGFEKRDRGTGRVACVFYEVTAEWWAVWVVVVDPEGREVERERVAYSEHQRLLESAFPVRSAVIKDGKFVLRDAARETLATVSLRD